MKKVLSIVLSVALVVGLLVGMPAYSTKADGTITNVTPSGTNVDLLSNNIYEFCANYEIGIAKSLYKQRSDTYFPTMVTFNWDHVSGASNYVLAIADNDKINNPITYSTPVNTIDVEDLNPGQTYYYRVGCATASGHYDSGIKSFTTTNLPKTITVNKVGNTRDIGGRYVNGGKQRILYGKVIRGANLDSISDAGKEKLLNVYGIKTDFDLRKGDNKEPVPSVSPLGLDVNIINIPGVEYAGKEKGIDNPSNYERTKKEILLFADANNFPIYVHCAIGRDRTGTICGLIEALLGVDKMEMYRDYEISYFSKEANNDIVDPDAATKSSFKRLMDFFENYSDGTIQQNVEKYMKTDLGITDEQIASIKKNLLTPLPVNPTVKPTVKPTNSKTTVKPGKVKIKKIAKRKKSAKKMKITLSKVANAKGYQVAIFTKKKLAKKRSKAIVKKYVKKTKFTIKSKKIKNKKQLFVRARAYNVVKKTKVFGSWSSIKKSKAK